MNNELDVHPEQVYILRLKGYRFGEIARGLHVSEKVVKEKFREYFKPSETAGVYPRLNLELYMKNITLQALAKRLKVSPVYMRNVFHDRKPLLFDFAKSVRNNIGSKVPLEELFKRGGETDKLEKQT